MRWHKVRNKGYEKMKREELHKLLFETLCIIDDICKKENVRWFLDSGTEIGSLREQNIIPWDDDIDIKVMREDYPAFCEAMRKHLPEYLHFIEPQDYSPAFYDFIPRIYDERYPLREETAEDRYYKNYQNRIGIDVFIYDVAPDNAFKREMMKVAEKIALGGDCVLTPVYPVSDNIERTKEQLIKLKEAHFKRIELSNAILVVNNYIGDSTNIEIDYAKKLGKEIMYYTDLILKI